MSDQDKENCVENAIVAGAQEFNKAPNLQYIFTMHSRNSVSEGYNKPGRLVYEAMKKCVEGESDSVDQIVLDQSFNRFIDDALSSGHDVIFRKRESALQVVIQP